MTKARLIYLLIVASLFAYFIVGFAKPLGMNDGGGLV